MRKSLRRLPLLADQYALIASTNPTYEVGTVLKKKDDWNFMRIIKEGQFETTGLCETICKVPQMWRNGKQNQVDIDFDFEAIGKDATALLNKERLIREDDDAHEWRVLWVAPWDNS